jgi:hypothetical protein
MQCVLSSTRFLYFIYRVLLSALCFCCLQASLYEIDSDKYAQVHALSISFSLYILNSVQFLIASMNYWPAWLIAWMIFFYHNNNFSQGMSWHRQIELQPWFYCAFVVNTLLGWLLDWKSSRRAWFGSLVVGRYTLIIFTYIMKVLFSHWTCSNFCEIIFSFYSKCFTI